MIRWVLRTNADIWERVIRRVCNTIALVHHAAEPIALRTGYGTRTRWDEQTIASQRAWRLLRPHLTEQQARDLLTRGYIIVDVRQRLRTRRWRIWVRSSNPIEELNGDGTIKRTWCIHVKYQEHHQNYDLSYPGDSYYPDYDRVLAWKLLVESAPKELHRIGNAW